MTSLIELSLEASMRIQLLGYSALLLVTLSAFLYFLWSYHECPPIKDKRPLIMPIFVSAAWFFVSVDGIRAIFFPTTTTLDKMTSIILIIVTLFTLISFVRHYIRGRHNDLGTTKSPLHHSDR